METTVSVRKSVKTADSLHRMEPEISLEEISKQKNDQKTKKILRKMQYLFCLYYIKTLDNYKIMDV